MARSGCARAAFRAIAIVGGGLVALGLLGFLFPLLSNLFAASFQSGLREDLARTAQLRRWAGMRTGVSAIVHRGESGESAWEEIAWRHEEATSFAAGRGGVGSGRAVARIEIPRIGLDQVVLDGVEPEQLAKGPGHYPTTPMPGAGGNCCIAGHRVTFGHPFRRLDQLSPGDDITLEADGARYRYTVASVTTVPKGDSRPLEQTAQPSLTLTTCHPPHSSTDRLVVRAVLAGH